MLNLTLIDRQNIKKIFDNLGTIEVPGDSIIELETVINKNKWSYDQCKRLIDSLEHISKKKSDKNYFQVSCNSQSNSNQRFRFEIIDELETYIQDTNTALS